MIFEEYNEQKAMKAAREHAEKRFNEGVEKGIEKGIEKGASEEKRQSVLRYSQLGLTAEQIAKGSDLPLEEVKKLLKEIVN